MTDYKFSALDLSRDRPSAWWSPAKKAAWAKEKSIQLQVRNAARRERKSAPQPSDDPATQVILQQNLYNTVSPSPFRSYGSSAHESHHHNSSDTGGSSSDSGGSSGCE